MSVLFSHGKNEPNEKREDLIMASPTKRTLDLLRNYGWTTQVVEKWEPHSKRRIDLFGGIDILAIRDNYTLGVQATSGGNISARIHKLIELPAMRLWLEGRDRRLHVWGWRKLKIERGKKAVRWTPKIFEITMMGLSQKFVWEELPVISLSLE